jgi:DNA-binding transcriptional LysR family regulator
MSFAQSLCAYLHTYGLLVVTCLVKWGGRVKSWSDIQIAYLVAKHGTLSKAAEVLDVHHSTVLRHIDAIEARLGCKLFHRHTRGYTPTDAGIILLQEAEKAEANIERLMGKINGADEQLSGPFVITSVSTLGPIIMPAIREFMLEHPSVDVTFQADSRIFKLEYGEAHVSIRPGAKPKDPDYVVQGLATTQSALYASSAYLSRHGELRGLDHLAGHRFVNFSRNMSNIPSAKWISDHVPSDQVSFKGSGYDILMDAALAGLGIVALDCEVAKHVPGLFQVAPPPATWTSSVWLVTHRDIHLSPKVQAFTRILKRYYAETL